MKVSLAVVVCALIVAWSLVPPTRAQDSALFHVGEVYEVVWSCLPGGLGCYGEALKIERVRPDGWVEVFQCGAPACTTGERWTVNLAQAASVRPFRPGGRAAN